MLNEASRNKHCPSVALASYQHKANLICTIQWKNDYIDNTGVDYKNCAPHCNINDMKRDYIWTYMVVTSEHIANVIIYVLNNEEYTILLNL